MELKPGQLIKENEICERFSVSRTPVRDALRLLQEQGFVVTVPYRGIYVTLLSLSNIKQMIYMRVAVETMVMRDFSQIATPFLMEDIYYMLRKQKALVQTENFKPEQFYRLDAQMHGFWFEATKKSWLWKLLQEQQLHYTRFRMLDFVTETDFDRIIHEHENLIEFLEKKGYCWHGTGFKGPSVFQHEEDAPPDRCGIQGLFRGGRRGREVRYLKKG